MKILSILVFVLVCTAPAQWSSDPAVNLLVSSGTNEADAPLIALGKSGDTYISWVEEGSSGYDMRLQRFDLFGNPLWSSGGIIVRENFTPLEIDLYDLTVDQSGAAVLTFSVFVDSAMVIYAYRISPDGDMLWGTDGILLSDTTITGSYCAFSQAASLASGDVVASWSVIMNPDTAWTVMQKISPDGDLLWGDGKTIGADSTGLYCWEATLCPTGSNDVILIYSISNHEGWYKRLYAMKWDSSANPVWSDPAVISESRDVVQQCIEPPPHPDGNNGFSISWQETDSSGFVTSLVQHVTSDGTLMMSDGGEPVSTMPARNHSEPFLSVMEDGLETSIFWMDSNELQSRNGLYGQRMDAGGSRLWTDSGISFIDLQSNGIGFISVQTTGNNAAVFYLEETDTTINDIAYCMLVDSTGGYVWPSKKVEISNVTCSRKHFASTPLCREQQFITVWVDDRGSNQSVYAQNIKLDGTLGPEGLGIGDRTVSGQGMSLYTAVPNPSSFGASVSFSLEKSSFVTLGLFDLSGRLVSPVADGFFQAGNHTAGIETGGIPSGVYILRLNAMGESLNRTCVLLR